MFVPPDEIYGPMIRLRANIHPTPPDTTALFACVISGTHDADIRVFTRFTV